MAERYFVVWTVKTEGVILPEERLPTGPTILVGLQHVVAMFGATVLAPLLMGFDPNVAIFFSGIATLIFFIVTGGRVPSYLGSSFAFIGPVLVAAVATGLCAVYAPGLARRIPILIGAIAGYVIYYIAANMGYGPPIDFSKVGAAAWLGLPNFAAPVFDPKAMVLIAPVAIVLVAENLGHIKAIGAMTARNLDPWLGRAFLADGIATMISASGGGTGVTTYAENMGVMAITRIYSTALFVAAAIIAILLGFSPKFGALIQTIPGPVLGGLSIVVFGLIAATAGRIWVENGVDFSKARNLITVAVALVLGAGNFKLSVAGFTLDGIGTATFGCIVLYHLLRGREEE